MEEEEEEERGRTRRSEGVWGDELAFLLSREANLEVQ